MCRGDQGRWPGDARSDFEDAPSCRVLPAPPLRHGSCPCLGIYCPGPGLMAAECHPRSCRRWVLIPGLQCELRLREGSGLPGAPGLHPPLPEREGPPNPAPPHLSLSEAPQPAGSSPRCLVAMVSDEGWIPEKHPKIHTARPPSLTPSLQCHSLLLWAKAGAPSSRSSQGAKEAEEAEGPGSESGDPSPARLTPRTWAPDPVDLPIALPQ